MSGRTKDTPLSAKRFELSMTTTVELTEIDGIEQGAILHLTDVGGPGRPSQDRELRTCYGDIYVIVNALRNYADLLEGAIREWSLAGYHAAIYELHAARCRKIAGKYASAIGYNYDKAIERCEKRRAKGERSDDTGMDGLEALVRKQDIRPSTQGKTNHTAG